MFCYKAAMPLSLMSCIVLTGCGLAHQAQIKAEAEQAAKTYDAGIAACERTFPDKYAKPSMPRMKCFNDANKARAERGDPNPDLVSAMGAQMAVAAEKYDNGHLSPTQFDAEKANVFADFTTKVAQRRNSASIARAANEQASAAQTQAAAAWQANLPKTTTCNTFGNSVTCY